MKVKYYLITFVVLLSQNILAQTSVVIPNGTGIYVPRGSTFCADTINVLEGGYYITDDSSGTCAGAIIRGGGIIESIDENVVVNCVPIEYLLHQNFPNPFNPITKISYEIPESGLVTLKVYDLLGNEIAKLVNENKPAGRYEVEFKAENLASGVYIYKLLVNDFIRTKKMILLR